MTEPSRCRRWTEEAEAESRGAGHPASDPHVHPPAPRPGRVPHAAGNASADAKGSPHAHADAQRCPYAHTDAVRAPNPHADAQAALSRADAPRNAHPNAADATVQPSAAAAATSSCIPTTTGAKLS